MNRFVVAALISAGAAAIFAPSFYGVISTILPSTQSNPALVVVVFAVVWFFVFAVGSGLFEPHNSTPGMTVEKYKMMMEEKGFHFTEEKK